MIRNFILRRMSMNRYGIFQFLKKQVSEHQKQYMELQQQYQNTESIDQQIQIMKGIVNIRHQIDEQDNVSLETLQSYYKFINDYQTCLRKRITINKETIELFEQVLQRFIDQTIFEKVKENSMFDFKNRIDKRFLQLNSLTYLLDLKYQSNEYEEISDISQKILEISQEISLIADSTIQYQVQILAFLQMGFAQYITGWHKEAEEPLKQGLESIQLLSQFYDDHKISISQSDKEWLFQIEVKFFQSLANVYNQLGQVDRCIEYQDKLLQLIKDYEGISQDYVYTLYELNNSYGQYNFYRQLKIIEETCSHIEKNEGYLLLQFQRFQVLYSLKQLNKQEFERIISLHQQININDDNFQTAFYGSILIGGIHLKQYSEINKQIDFMFSYISTITNNQIDLIIGQRKTLYEEFLYRKQNHKKNVYEKTMLYYQEKTYPYFAEIQRQFAENYFNLSVGRQREIGQQMLHILRDYLTRSIYGNDNHLVRKALEKTFKLFLNNSNYREILHVIFQKFNNTQNIPPQVKIQLSKYIQQLEQAKDQQ